LQSLPLTEFGTAIPKDGDLEELKQYNLHDALTRMDYLEQLRDIATMDSKRLEALVKAKKLSPEARDAILELRNNPNKLLEQYQTLLGKDPYIRELVASEGLGDPPSYYVTPEGEVKWSLTPTKEALLQKAARERMKPGPYEAILGHLKKVGHMIVDSPSIEKKMRWWDKANVALNKVIKLSGSVLTKESMARAGAALSGDEKRALVAGTPEFAQAQEFLEEQIRNGDREAAVNLALLTKAAAVANELVREGIWAMPKEPTTDDLSAGLFITDPLSTAAKTLHALDFGKLLQGAGDIGQGATLPLPSGAVPNLSADSLQLLMESVKRLGKKLPKASEKEVLTPNPALEAIYRLIENPDLLREK